MVTAARSGLSRDGRFQLGTHWSGRGARCPLGNRGRRADCLEALTSFLGRHSTEKVSIPWDLVKTEQDELRLSGDWLIGASLSQ